MVGQVGDEGARGRLEGRESDAHRVAPVERHVAVALQRAHQCELEPAVDLDGVDVGAALGEVGRERADAGADLERHVIRPERRQPVDHPQQVVVHEEVLPELACRAAGRARPDGPA